MSRWLLTALCSMLLFALAGVAPGKSALTPEETAYLREKGTITFVSQKNYPPFEFATEEGGHDGMCIELVRWIATEFGFRANFTSTNFDEAQQRVLDGRADVLTSLFHSPRRDEQFDFTDMKFEVPATIFVNVERVDIRSAEDLRGKRLAMQKADYALEFLENHGIDVELVPTADFREALRKVAEGEADAMIGDEQIVLYYIFTDGWTEQVKKVGEPLYQGRNCMATREGEALLVSILNKGLQRARESGTGERIHKKWLGTTFDGRVPSPGLEQYLVPASITLGGIALLVIVVLGWNLQLRKLVRRKTSELQASEERFRAIADYSYNWEAWYGTDGALLWMNPAVTRISGHSIDDCMAMSRFPLPLVDVGREEIERLLFTGENTTGPQGEVTFALKRKDGEVRWIAASRQPIFDAAGRPMGHRASFRDITDRKNDREAMANQSALLASLVDSIPDQIYYKDGEGRYLGCNAAFAEFVGRPKAEIVGMTDAQLFPLCTAPRESDRQREEWVDTRDGRRVLLESVQTPFFGPDGTVLGMVGIRRDITARKRREEENAAIQSKMQQAQKLENLGIMAGGIAHDFNNLLQGILGNVELALVDLPGDSPLAESLTDVELSSRQAAELCQEMLAYAGKGPLLLRPISLNEVIEHIDNLFRISVSKRCQVTTELFTNLSATRADATQLRQVLLNLVINASEAIGDRNGRIVIRTGQLHLTAEELRTTRVEETLQSGEFVYMEVEDDGPGMEAEVAKRIFDPFFTTKFTGRGLGLASVMGIIRGHGGTIIVDTTPGVGTRFRIFLPATDEAAQPLARHDRAEAIEFHATGTVLLVDDEPSVLRIGRKMLERIGFTVVTCASAPEALDYYREQGADSVDLAILDMTMPEMSGAELYRGLRSLAPTLRIIVCSGYAEHQVNAQLDGENDVCFIQKPFQMAVLTQKIKLAMG